MTSPLRSVVATARLTAACLLIAAPALPQPSMQVVSCWVTAFAGSSSQSGAIGSASASEQVGACNAQASALAFVSGLSVTVIADALSTGLCIPGPLGGSGLSASASADMTVRLSAPTPTAGSLTLAQLSGGPLVFHTYIDIDGTGTTQPRGSQIPIVIDSTGITIKIGASTPAAWPPFGTGGRSMVSVTFVPTPSAITTSLMPCGPELSVWNTRPAPGRANLEFRAHRLSTSAFPFLVFGLQPVRIPIPPTGCLLGTSLLAFVPLVPETSTVRYSVALGPSVSTGGFLVQILQAELQSGQPIWRTSNVVDVQLP